jgi:hypothetical protein
MPGMMGQSGGMPGMMGQGGGMPGMMGQSGGMPGMMGQGGGMPGMMGQSGGMPGMMGQGGGMPGMMGQSGGMPGMMGQGGGVHGMMGQGGGMPGMMGHGMMDGAALLYGLPSRQQEEVTPEQVRLWLERELARHGNPRLAIGEIIGDDDSITATIVTVDGSLVQKLAFNRFPGLVRQVVD